MPVRNLRDGVITIQVDDDGTGDLDEVEVTLEEGNLAWEELRPVNVILDRGRLHHVRRANDEMVEVTFSVYFQSFTTHAATTLYDALKGIGGAAAWVSQGFGVGSDVYAVRLHFLIDDPAGGDAELIRFESFQPETVAFEEGDEANTLRVTGVAPLRFVSQEELVTNGTFATDTGWSHGSNWEISGGTLHQTSPASSSTDHLISAGMIDRREYMLTYTVSGRTAGGVTPEVAGGAGTERTTNGTFVEIITASVATTGGAGQLSFAADGTWDGAIDNVSLRPVSHAGAPF